jgi:hypothetical protein
MSEKQETPYQSPLESEEELEEDVHPEEEEAEHPVIPDPLETPGGPGTVSVDVQVGGVSHGITGNSVEQEPRVHMGSSVRRKKKTTVPQENLVKMHEQLRQSVDQLTRSMEHLAARDEQNRIPVAPGTSGQSASAARKASSIMSHNDNPRRKFAEPSKFSGEDLPWEEYLIGFEDVADWNKWDEEDCRGYLLLSLSGDALLHVHSIEHFREKDYYELCDLLKEKFGAGRTVAEDKRKFRLRKRQKGETYSHVAQDLLRLAKRIYRRDHQQAEEEAKEQFLRCLPKLVRIGVTASNPKTIEDCVSSLRQVQMVEGTEELDEIIKGPLSSRMVRTENDGFRDDNIQDGRNGQNRNRGRNGYGRGRYRSRGRGRYGSNRPEATSAFDITKEQCWNCGELGHLKNECTQPWGIRNRNRNSAQNGKVDRTAEVEQETLPKQQGNDQGSA